VGVPFATFICTWFATDVVTLQRVTICSVVSMIGYEGARLIIWIVCGTVAEYWNLKICAWIQAAVAGAAAARYCFNVQSKNVDQLLQEVYSCGNNEG